MPSVYWHHDGLLTCPHKGASILVPKLEQGQGPEAVFWQKRAFSIRKTQSDLLCGHSDLHRRGAGWRSAANVVPTGPVPFGHGMLEIHDLLWSSCWREHNLPGIYGLVVFFYGSQVEITSSWKIVHQIAIPVNNLWCLSNLSFAREEKKAWGSVLVGEE